MQVPERIAALRALMKENELAAYVVPSTDPHQSEYVAPVFKRRQFISGFSGSAGTVALLADRAGLWTDSRYFLQAEEQLAQSGIDLFRMGDKEVPELQQWLSKELPQGARVGVDARVFSVDAYTLLASALEPKGVELVPMEQDLVAQVQGSDLPEMPKAPVRAHPSQLAGSSVDSKMVRVRSAMESQGADALVLSALDEIAWLFNLRGADVSFNRVFIAYAIVEKNRTSLFVDPDKLDEETRNGLPSELLVMPYESFEPALRELGGAGPLVWLDPASTSQQVAGLLLDAGGQALKKTSPIPLWKASKNEAEIEGMRAAHVRDGLAMVRFLRWLPDAVAQGGQSELSVATRLEEFRAELEHYIGLSFATISGYKGHGAIVHYSVSEESSSDLAADGIFLVDSGGQFVDGTTDITRTVALGTVGPEEKRAYTAVLKGHLRLSRTRFIAGSDGHQLDILARADLWEQGLNYGHGTGHGVGAALCVHEGPFSVSPRKVLVPLAPGNILSIEPGYYKTDEYGIRIENLALVVQAPDNESGSWLEFETLTLCPYDRQLIDLDMLSPVERQQIDRYHARVFETLSADLDEEDKNWLQQATQAL